jgi:predicted dehydrogenase
MTRQKMKVGIISANWSLKVHGSAWRLLPDVEVAAICTAHRETAAAAAQAFGIRKAYWDFEQMTADPELDIIDVGTRPSFRRAMVLSALRNGKHVYSALPFAENLEAAEQMCAEQLRNKRVGVVDAQFRWVPAAQHLKALIEAGFIGTPLGFNIQLFLPLSVEGAKVFPHSVYPEGGLTPYKWLAEKDSGAGGWRNFATHSLLLLTHLLGTVADVAGCVSKGVLRWDLPDGTTLIPENEDLGQATLRLSSGVTGTVQAGWCVPDTEGLRLEIWGDRGRVLLVDPRFGDGISARLYAGRGRVGSYGETNGAWVDIPPRYFEVPGTGFNTQNAPPYMVSMGWMFHHMLTAIREAGPGSPSFSEAVHVQRVVEAVIRSGRERRWIAIAGMT